LNIRDLEYLVAVHDVNNFSRAAEICNVSQPTLSGQLKKLESDLDAHLMERSTRRVLFTPIGKTVVEHARDVLSMVDKIQGLAKANNDPMVGDFHIGMLPSVGPFLLPTLMPDLSEQYPNLNLFLYELKKEQLLDKLYKGELDAIVLAKQSWNQPVDETPLYTEKLMLAVSSDDELSKNTNDSVSCKAIKDRSILMLEDGYCLRDQAMNVCETIGAKEDKRYKATSMDILLHMVKSNKGITLMPQMACDESLTGIDFLPFQNPKAKRDVVMLSRKGSIRKETLDLLATAISDTASKKITNE